MRELIERPAILPAMGGYDALSARLVEQAGGEVVYMSGSSVSTSVHGFPDVGLTTMTEMVDRARGMAGVGAFDLLGQENPDVRLHLFNDCGHLPYREHPAAFSRLVTGFADRRG
ncbi:hypothetical protein ACFQE8_17820 [Salinirubellus sp. GCM10025818]